MTPHPLTSPEAGAAVPTPPDNACSPRVADEPSGPNHGAAALPEENGGSYPQRSDPSCPSDAPAAAGVVAAEGLRALQSAEHPETAFLQLLLSDGCSAPGDSGASLESRPPWVDEKKILLGQQFAQKYYSGVMLANVLSILIIYSVTDSLKPLIFSGNSDTPFKAFRRYLSTVSHVTDWYSGDLWATEGKAHQRLRAVRQLHVLYRRRIRDTQPAERAKRSTLQPPLWTGGATDAVREDFRDATAGCPCFSGVGARHEWINQMEMSMTQFSFAGLVVLYPERFGAAGATDEELEGFVHLWRVLGYLLGVEDRLNFCTAELKTMRTRSLFFLRSYLVPALTQVDTSWEHLTRCMVDSVSYYVPCFSYEMALAYMCETIGVAAPRVEASLGAKQRLDLRLTTLMMCWGMRVPPLRALLNRIVVTRLKGAETASPEWLSAQKAKVYDYQRASSPPSDSAASGTSSPATALSRSLPSAWRWLTHRAESKGFLPAKTFPVVASYALLAVLAVLICSVFFV